MAVKFVLDGPKEYKVWDKLNFGKYDGWEVQQVCMQDPGYVNWLCENIYTFYLNDETIDMLTVVNPRFNISYKAKEALLLKKRSMAGGK